MIFGKEVEAILTEAYYHDLEKIRDRGPKAVLLPGGGQACQAPGHASQHWA